MGNEPKFTNCVRDNKNQIWCFDDETEEIYKINLEKYALEKISPEVLFDLLKTESRKNMGRV